MMTGYVVFWVGDPGSEVVDWRDMWPGQVIVCENVGADWLPFQPWRDIKASDARHGGKVSREAFWVRGCDP